MKLSRRSLIATAATLPAPGLFASAKAQAVPTLKIGCLTDMSGPYKDLVGPGAVAAVNQAIGEFGTAGKGFKVEVLVADHLNKPDVGTTIARQWYDRDGVD